MPPARNRAPIVQPAARARVLTVQAAHRAARARIELAIVVPLISMVLLLNEYRCEEFGLDLPVRVFTAIALLILGWRLARDVGRTLAPQLLKRMDPATAGTVGSLIRPAFPRRGDAAGAADRRAGAAQDRRLGRDPRRRLRPRRPADARQPDRGRGADLGATVQGRRPRSVAVRRARGRDRWRRVGARPALHHVRARRGLDHGAEQHRARLRGRAAARAVVRQPARAAAARRDSERGPGAARRAHHHRGALRAHIGVEEIDSDEVVVRIAATSAADSDGQRLADEILAAIAPITREGLTEEREAARAHAGRPTAVTPESRGATSVA